MIATTFDGREKLKGQNNPRTNMGLVYEFELNRFWRDLKKRLSFLCPLRTKTDKQIDNQTNSKKKKLPKTLSGPTRILCVNFSSVGTVVFEPTPDIQTTHKPTGFLRIETSLRLTPAEGFQAFD